MVCWYFSWLRSTGEVAGSFMINNFASTKQLVLHSLCLMYRSWRLRSLENQINPGRTCSLCLATDDSREECALVSMEGRKTSLYPSTSRNVQANHQPHRFTPIWSPSPGFCYRYNAGSCNSSPCWFKHACMNCFSPGRPEFSCPESRGRPKICSEQRAGGHQHKPLGGLPANKAH